MPAGHTTKQTLTHFRAGLLASLPAKLRELSNPVRKQVNDMVRYGWASEVNGVVYRTPLGAKLLNEKNEREGFPLVKV